MAITNLYPNLPAHLVQFKDGGLTAVDQATDRSGKSLLLLGTAYDGPVMEPVQIDAATVAKVFGDEVDSNGVSNGATLTKYAKQALKNGFNDVRCMRVTGSPASVKITKSVVTNVEQVASGSNSLYTFGGNAAESVTLGYKSETGFEDAPFKTDETIVYIDGQMYDSLQYTMQAVPGTIDFMANKTRQYASGTIDYKYYDIQEKTIEVALKAIGEGTDIGFDKDDIVAALAAETDNYTRLYISANEADVYKNAGVLGLVNPEDDQDISADDYTFTALTNGFNVVVNAETLVKEAGDPIKVKVYAYDLIPVTGEAFELTGTYDGVTVDLPEEILPDTFVILGKTKGTDYTVTENTITFLKAGKWAPGTVTAAWDKEVENTTEESFIINSNYGGAVYNDAKVQFVRNENNTMRIIFTKPASKIDSEMDKPFYYDTAVVGEEGLRTVGQLRDMIENYTYNIFNIVCDDEDLLLEEFPEGEYQLAGGSDGVNVSADDLFKALSGTRWMQEDVDNGDCTAAQLGYLREQGAYQLLENYNVDYIIPVGVYADVVPPTAKALHTTFHNELALICAVLTYRTKMTHGFIDVKPNVNTTLKGIEAHCEKLLKYDNLHYMQDQDGTILVDSEGTKMDIGWYTSIVVGPDPIMVSDKLGRYYGSAAIAYAALCKSLKPQSSPTNKRLPGVVGMKYIFSNKQQNELVGNNFVVFKTKNSAGTSARSSEAYVIDGRTAGAPNCDYGRISTVQVVTDVVDQIREVCEPFLGEPNTVEQRNAMSALISKRLGKLLEDGEIQWYEFSVSATVQEVLLGECSITLTLIVPQELRKITTTVALRAAA